VIGSPDEDAIQLDLYLDHVLAGGRAASISPSTTAENVDLSRTARLVASGAGRFHPSFRFEERLAVRLRDVASGLDVVVPGRDVVVPGRDVVVPGRGVLVPFAPGLPVDPTRARHLGGLLLGGAIASGVSIASLAGAAALVVWRRARWERLV